MSTEMNDKFVAKKVPNLWSVKQNQCDLII